MYSWRKGTRRSGMATVELAVLLPFLCLLFVIALDFSRVFYCATTVDNCARNGAVYGSQDPAAALDQTGISTVARKDASNLDSSKLTVTSATDSSTKPTKVTVTVTYPFTTVTKYPGVRPMTLSRAVTMSVTPWEPN